MLKNETLLEKQRKEIKDMTSKPMNTMLAKQPRDEAIKKREMRKAKVTRDVPPTAGSVVKMQYTYRPTCAQPNFLCLMTELVTSNGIVLFNPSHPAPSDFTSTGELHRSRECKGGRYFSVTATTNSCLVTPFWQCTH